MLTNKQKKSLGWGVLIAALFFLNPIMDVSDFLILPLYAMYSGVDVTVENLSIVYLDYFMWCMVIGIILLTISMNLLGWNLKRLWKKIDPGKYRIAIGLSIFVVALIAYLDIQGMIYWASFSSEEAYTSGLQGLAFWNFFKSIAFSLMLIVPICYWFFVRKDKSEVLALFLSSYILWMFCFSDLLYFIFQRKIIPSTLPWLINHPVAGWVSSNLFGNPMVTSLSLITTVIIGFVIVFFMTKILKEKF